MPKIRSIVRLVFGEQQWGVAFAIQISFAKIGVRGRISPAAPFLPRDLLQRTALACLATSSRCCETRASAGRASAAASGPRLHTLIWIRMSSGPCLGVLDEHVEVAIVVEDAGVE